MSAELEHRVPVLQLWDSHALLHDARAAAYIRLRARCTGSTMGAPPLKTKLGRQEKLAALPLALSGQEVVMACVSGWLGVAHGEYTDGAMSGHAIWHGADARRPSPVAAVRWADLQKLAAQVDPVKMAAFAYMWQQGYWMTVGLRFGCDFLVYQSDAAEVHAFAALTAVPEGPGSSRLGVDWAASVRTAVSSSKCALVCEVVLEVPATAQASGSAAATPSQPDTAPLDAQPACPWEPVCPDLHRVQCTGVPADDVRAALRACISGAARVYQLGRAGSTLTPQPDCVARYSRSHIESAL